MEISISLAKPFDVPEMAKILSLSWEAAYKDIIPMEYILAKNFTRLDLFKRIITDENTSEYIIKTGGKSIGIMSITPPRDEDISENFYELNSIYLHPNYYHQGIGSTAMNFAFSLARSLGKQFLVVWVFSENTNTVNFYSKCGFTPDGKTKTLDYGKLMNCIRMIKAL